MNLTLHELLSIEAKIAAALDESGGEITERVAALMDELGDGSVEAKVDGYRRILALFTARGEARRAEAERLDRLADADTRAVQRLKDRMRYTLQAFGVSRVITVLGNVSVCRNPRPSIQWCRPLEELPEHLRKVTVSVDGAAAQALLKSAGELPQGFLVEHGTHLRIT